MLYRFPFLCKLALVTLYLMVGVSFAQAEEHLTLNQGWQFCPVQNYQPQMDIALLDCSPIELPNRWETVRADYDGFGILFRTITPEEIMPLLAQHQPIGLSLSRVRDADKVFFNHHLVGETGDFPPNFQKAVLYPRLYSIPTEWINTNQNNQLLVWIYNDARPGGIANKAPELGFYQNLVAEQHQQNSVALVFIVITGVFSLLHLVYFCFHRHLTENIYYSLFLLSWSAYLFVFSEYARLTPWSMNSLFRANIGLFFLVFSLFPVFVFKFFNYKMPIALKVIIGIVLAMIPLCVLLPEPKLLYYPLQLAELLTIPALLFTYLFLFKAIRAKLPYAKTFSIVLLLYSLLGCFDIMVDLLQLQARTTLQLFVPWALILLTIAMTIIISHKNLLYYQHATFDRLTNTLRFDEFLSRLDAEFFRASRDKKITLVAMVDLDNFKIINDQYGHLCGDQALQKMAETIRQHLRQFDLLGRFGGDEFCISATFEFREEAIRFLERIHLAIQQLSYPGEKVELKMSATFGAAFRHPDDQMSALSLVEKADQRLIETKAIQKGTVGWPPPFINKLT